MSPSGTLRGLHRIDVKRLSDNPKFLSSWRRKHWKDLCVVNSGRGSSYPCEWIVYNPEKNIVWLKGREPGAVIGPASRKAAGENGD